MLSESQIDAAQGVREIKLDELEYLDKSPGEEEKRRAMGLDVCGGDGRPTTRP